VTLTVRKLLPVGHILAKIHLLGEPSDRRVLLVLLPDIRILDGKENKAIARGVKERLGELDGHLLILGV
jgi:hypothetical protein